MWVVGDASTHEAFLAALAGSRGVRTVVTSYLDGAVLGDVTINGGAVRVSGRSQVRRRAVLSVPEASWTSLLSPYGVQVRVWQQVLLAGYAFPSVPLFTGRVERRSRVRRSGVATVECWDRMADVNDDSFELPRAAPAGMTIPAAIGMLLQETCPDALVTDTTGSTAAVPVGLTWDAGDGSRGLAVAKMALSIGAEAVALPDGNFLIRPYPLLTDPPVWSVATGVGGVIVGDAQDEARTAVANRWIITGNQTAAAASVREVVTNTDTGSPLRYGGPYGRVVRTYTDPMITTSAQARAAGYAILARVGGMARQRTLEVMANPALEAGDVVSVSTSDGVEVHIADDFAVPLSVETGVTMSVASRSEAV